MDDFELELKQGFLEEAGDLLTKAEEAFLGLEQDKGNTSILDEIFRIAHNLKGTSKAVGFDQMSELVHIAEDLILKIKDGSVELTDGIVTIFLQFNDALVLIVDCLGKDYNATIEIDSLLESLRQAAAGELKEEVRNEETPVTINNNIESSNIDVVKDLEGMLEDLEKELGDPVVFEETIQPIEKKKVEKVDVPVLETPSEPIVAKKVDIPQPIKQEKKAPVAKNKETAGNANAPEVTLRVALGRIEKLNDIVSELVILQSVLDQRRLKYSDDKLMNKSILQLGKLSKEVQSISMSLRMVPLKTTFHKMSRIVRDVSKKLDKEVELVIVGENTEVDKTVLELLGDPLVHIIRNAVDHGLEPNEKRVAIGKKAVGTIEIAAFHEGNNLVIRVTDNGNGIDPTVIRRKAIENGIIKEGTEISDNEMIQFIFHPGFSTKEEVSVISGRGVGMDVVKTNIEKLSGKVELTSTLGTGSVFKIILPLTLSIIDGMVILAGNERYIIPLEQVHEFVRPTNDMLTFVSGLGECVTLRDDVIPIFNFSSFVGKQTVKKTTDDNKSDGNKIILIAKGREQEMMAIEVDDIINQQQVVIKQLGAEVKDSKGIVGISILGDGKPAFIIDMPELATLKSRR